MGWRISSNRGTGSKNQASQEGSVQPSGHDISMMVLTHLSTQDIANLYLVNSYTRNFVEPVLYSKFSWTWSTEQEQEFRSQKCEDNSLDGKNSALVLFIRTLMDRPDLATHVKAITLIDPRPFPRPLRTTSLDVAKASRLMEPCLPRPYEIASYRLRWGELGKLVALLLSQVRNLRSLELDRIFNHDLAYMGIFCDDFRVLRENRKPFFPHLKKIMYQSPESRGAGSNEPSRTRHVIQLPGIETASLTLYFPHWPLDPLRRDASYFYPCRSSIVELCVENIREKSLPSLLQNMGLKKLTYGWTYDPSDLYMDGPGVQRIYLDNIVQALSSSWNTLTHLTIENRSGPYTLHHPKFMTLGSLRGLREQTKLQHLELPLHFIAGYQPAERIRIQEVIPKQVESLVITDSFWPHPIWDRGNRNRGWGRQEILDLVGSFLKTWMTTNPWLKTLTLSLDSMQTWANVDWGQLDAWSRMYDLKVITPIRETS
ncbi:hypothetical protein BDZ85DRAFT_268722 [Elsinoe ampelina]|uniref:F-box domain-containing protein n=1 Tax=Elsinoe ampelina TaxID=302913 RepID=A0A6A6G1M3_9PEZI|nr:hypothetical protein BDZ85DRAFT_268722 [Elsinoe ampelina]